MSRRVREEEGMGNREKKEGKRGREEENLIVKQTVTLVSGECVYVYSTSIACHQHCNEPTSIYGEGGLLNAMTYDHRICSG